MARIIEGVDIDRVYTFDQIMEMYHRGQLKPIALQGMVVRADFDGTVRFVPWHESTAARLEAGSPVTIPNNWQEPMRQEIEEKYPIRRRTPQQRVASMMVRMLADVKRTGTIRGLSEAQIRTITGEAWKRGETRITMEMVRKVAAHYLGLAEKQNREADRKRTTREHPTA